jgi:acetyl esterase
MLSTDPAISPSSALSARLMQAAFPLMFRLQSMSPEVQFATQRISKPSRLSIPTRHGDVKALVYAPTTESVATAASQGQRPPVHLILHGGAFIVRRPQQEDNVARYLASEIGTYVVVPDYDTAPKVRFPVSEEQSFDVFQWIHAHGAENGWDGDRATVGGPSSGGKMALSVVTQAIDSGAFVPLAVSTEYGVADLARPDGLRQSPKARPVVPTQMMQLVKDTYFVGTDLHDPRVSPAMYSRLGEFPPTLVMTAELDTLKHEMNDFAEALRAAGARVTHREFDGVDHGFTHSRPVDVARQSIAMIGTHLQAAYSPTNA